MKSLSMKTIAGLCAAASVLTISAAAIAQDGPPQGGFGARGGRGGDPAERAQRLHDQLQITGAQEQAFQTWQAAMKPPADRPDREAMRNLTTPQRLDQQLAQGAQRQADLKVRADATKRFYNQLSAAQRTTMDGLPPMMLAMEGRGGPGGRGPGGGRGRGGPDGQRGPNAGFGGPQNFNGQ